MKNPSIAWKKHSHISDLFFTLSQIKSIRDYEKRNIFLFHEISTREENCLNLNQFAK